MVQRVCCQLHSSSEHPLIVREKKRCWKWGGRDLQVVWGLIHRSFVSEPAIIMIRCCGDGTIMFTVKRPYFCCCWSLSAHRHTRLSIKTTVKMKPSPIIFQNWSLVNRPLLSENECSPARPVLPFSQMWCQIFSRGWSANNRVALWSRDRRILSTKNSDMLYQNYERFTV